MKLRATYRAPDAGRYRAPGGAVGRPGARPRHAATTAGVRCRPRRRGAPVRRAQLESLVAGLAGGLRSMGVRRGDVVTWQMPNWWEALVLYRACWRCGAVAAPLHHQFGAAEVAYMVDLLEPKVAFSSPVLPLAEREGTIGVRSEDARFELVGGEPPTPGRAPDPEPSGRPGRGHLHLGIDGPAQGRAPYPSGLGLQGADDDRRARALRPPTPCSCRRPWRTSRGCSTRSWYRARPGMRIGPDGSLGRRAGDCI